MFAVSRARNGHVVERQWKSGRGYALRFFANGRRQYVTLGLERDGWNRTRAEDELLNVMADVRRGIWIPPDRARASRPANGAAAPSAAGSAQHLADDLDCHRCDPAGVAVPTFHAFATGWLARREGEVAPRTVEYERWALTHHLLPHFAHTPRRRSTSRRWTPTAAPRSRNLTAAAKRPRPAARSAQARPAPARSCARSPRLR